MSRRISQLDGLRGLAALMVVVHHSFLVSPVFGEEHSSMLSPSDGWEWWAKYTPLNTLWNGSLAVQIFFVLSGFVLAIPFLNHEREPSWLGYYPRRLVRLYLPVWGAVVFALVLYFAFSRESSSSQSWWVNRHDVPLALKPILADMVLVRGTSWYNSPLWSLQYEVIFSLLLPAFLLLAVLFKKMWPAVLALLLLAAHWGASIDNGLLQYLPVFGIGVVLAVRRDLLDRLAQRAPHALWLALTAVVVGAGSWRSDLFGPFAPTVLIALFVVVIFYGWDRARRLGNARSVQWLGARSFSLYLTHEPVIVSVAIVTGWTNPLVVTASALPLSLAVSAVFFRLVEAPSHRASRSVGSWVDSAASKWYGRTQPEKLGQ